MPTATSTEPKGKILSAISRIWHIKYVRLGIYIIPLLALLLIFKSYYQNELNEGLATLRNQQVGESLPFLIPVGFLLAIMITGCVRLYQVRDVSHEYIEYVILLITVASYFAFGLPKEFTPQAIKEKFAELCVILTLFLLAELAAALTFQAVKVQHSIEQAEANVIKNLTDQTDLSIKNINNVLSDVLQTKKELADVLDAVGEIKDDRVRAKVLTNVVKYSGAWANFFDDISRVSPESLNCCMSLFEIYVEKEVKNLGKYTLAIVTNDELYLNALAKMLESISRDKEKPLFAWAITNILPESWFHWGQKYGHFGRNQLMDDFRNDVAQQVREGREYRRMFLVQWAGFQNIPTQYGERLSRLSPETELYEMSQKVILLFSENQSDAIDDSFSEACHNGDFWKSILGDDVAKREGLEIGMSYGIISKDHLPSGWEVDKVVHRPAEFAKQYSILPRYLLEYWEQKYQSHKSDKDMSIYVVSNEEDLRDLPEYTDLLLLGVKEADTYRPIIAMSADISQDSKTMLMRILTSPDELKELMEKWKKAEKNAFTRQQFLDAYRNMPQAGVNAGAAQPEAGVTFPSPPASDQISTTQPQPEVVNIAEHSPEPTPTHGLDGGPGEQNDKSGKNET